MTYTISLRNTTPAAAGAALAELVATNADLNRRDALQMLDALEEFQYSEASMLAELRFNFGYTEEQSGAVYREWIRRVE